MTLTTAVRPTPEEFAGYYARYIALVPEAGAVAALERQGDVMSGFLGALSEAQGTLRYGAEKWSVKQVLGHVADAERVFAYRAMRFVRSRASEWNIDANRIGILGFSAGGEVAALASTKYDAGNAGAADPIERFSSRPAFEALIYPGIPKQMVLTKQTPPAFLVCGEQDRPGIAQGLPELYLALKRAGVSAELHVYAGVGHGFGVRATNRPPVSGWLQLFLDWLTARQERAAKP